MSWCGGGSFSCGGDGGSGGVGCGGNDSGGNCGSVVGVGVVGVGVGISVSDGGGVVVGVGVIGGHSAGHFISPLKYFKGHYSQKSLFVSKF